MEIKKMLFKSQELLTKYKDIIYEITGDYPQSVEYNPEKDTIEFFIDSVGYTDFYELSVPRIFLDEGLRATKDWLIKDGQI